jgi:hypothetical protein
VIDVDLSRYFDTIRHSVLLDKIAQRVQDSQVMYLVKQMLKAGGKSGVPQGGASYTSNNVAKLPLEFSWSIAREGLKVRYGEGFGGAPLRFPPATHRVTTGAETSSDEQTQAQRSTTVGGDDHV